MKKKSTIVIVVLLVANLCFTAVVAFFAFSSGDGAPSDGKFEVSEQYVMFIGTNDKDTYEPRMPLDEAKDLVNNLLAKHNLRDFTVFEANGGWVDDTGTPTLEATLVYIVYGATEEQLLTLAEDIRVSLNQSAVAIQKLAPLSYMQTAA